MVGRELTEEKMEKIKHIQHDLKKKCNERCVGINIMDIGGATIM